MKKPLKILFWIIVILVGIFIFLNIAFFIVGRPVLLSQIQKATGRKTSVRSVGVGFPLSLKISGLEVEGLAKVDSFSTRLGLLGFLAGKIGLNDVKIVRPQITIEKDASGKFLILPESKGKPPAIYLTGLDIKDGSIVFIDKQVDPQGNKIILSMINAQISKAVFPPTSLNTKFKLSAKLGENQQDGSLSADGWIDFGPKNMEGTVDIKDVNLVSFSPYLKDFLGEKKLSGGKLSLASELFAKNNNLLAKCHLEILGLAYQGSGSPDPSQAGNIAEAFLTTLTDESGKVVLDFTLPTKLDKPNLQVATFGGLFGHSILDNLSKQPPEKTINNIKNIGDQFENIGKNFKKMFKKDEGN